MVIASAVELLCTNVDDITQSRLWKSEHRHHDCEKISQ